ncbi:hypothetical protein TSMG0036 [Halocynthia phage JM-2012]|uniref:hypothetical protein n=1 Tax=Halocynthia phage JM-2012 TaxID=1173297 RepID=UPI00025C68F3|nr:hypothetical protein TSMG0036 [Halocynthia phage JM-2012]AFI55319.1 hypothetical protein TSMG0036 [Halocynthia phage JM-2012]
MTLPREAVGPETRNSSVDGLVPFTEISYINKTGKTVYLKDRHGAHQAIPSLPAEAKHDGYLHMKVSYHCMLSAQLSFDNQDNQFQEVNTPMVARRATTQYSVNPSDCAYGEVIFSQELGLLISFNRPLTFVDVFPDTSRAVPAGTYQSSDRIVSTVDLSIGIVIVDNVNPNSPYFINVENRVYKLFSRTSEDAGNLSDGVHVLDTRTPVDGSREARYDLNECTYDGSGKFTSPFTLFTNPHDAKTNGHRNALIEAERHEMEMKLKAQENDVLNLKALIAKAKEEAALRKEALDAVSDHRKDYYEGRSYTRKDTSEGISMPAKIIGGIGAIAAAIFGAVKLLA